MPNITAMNSIASSQGLAADRGNGATQLKTAVEVVEAALEDDNQIDGREAAYLKALAQTSNLGSAAREYLSGVVERNVSRPANQSGTPPTLQLADADVVKVLATDQGNGTSQLDAAVKLVDVARTQDGGALSNHSAALVQSLSHTYGLGSAAAAYLRNAVIDDEPSAAPFVGSPAAVTAAVDTSLAAIRHALDELQDAIEAAPTKWPKRQHVFGGAREKLEKSFRTLEAQGLSGAQRVQLDALLATYNSLRQLSHQHND